MNKKQYVKRLNDMSIPIMIKKLYTTYPLLQLYSQLSKYYPKNTHSIAHKTKIKKTLFIKLINILMNSLDSINLIISIYF